MLLWSTIAFAVIPDGNPGFIEVGNGAIERMVVSDDGEILAGRDRATGTFFVLPVDSWEPQTGDISDCGVTGVALKPSTLEGTSSDAQDVFISCDDGSIRWWVWSDEELGPVLQEDAEGNQEPYSLGVTVNNDPFTGIWWNLQTNEPRFYLMEQAQSEGAGYVHVFSPANGGQVNGQVSQAFTNNPITAGSGFQEGVVDQNVLYLAHGSGRTTLVNLSTGGVSLGGFIGAQLYTIDDVAPGNGKLWAVDTQRGFLFEFFPQAGNYGTPYTGFNQPAAVVANLEIGDEWLMVSGQGIWIYELQGGQFVDFNTPSFVNLDAEINIQDAVTSGEYTFGGGIGGNVQIITAKPWVEAQASIETGTIDEVFDLQFTVDDPSDWVVTRGGNRTGNGSVIATGTTTEVDSQVTVPVTINDNWAEGPNRIYVVATNSRGLEGHDRVTVSIDGPPDAPTLTPAGVGFANGALNLTFAGIPDEDLALYDIYVSDTEFAPGDYPTGGPPGPEGGPEVPVRVTALPGATVDARIAPLENGTTYYIAARATDAGGQESSMSNVVQGIPEEDFTAADLAGEQGGGSCATGVGSGSAVLGGLGMMLAMGRRRRSILGAGLNSAVLVGVVGGLLASGSAMAAEETGDFGPQRGNFELRYGNFLSLADDDIKQVYGDSGHNMLQLEFGPQFFRFFEVDLQVGFYQELATTVSASGDPSDVKTMLTWFPLGLSGTFRLQILDEQVVVPHARLGADLVPWTELTDNGTGGKDRLAGSKVGHHYAFGASLLLDIFAPARASLLEAQTGINDTYVTIEWRRQNIDSRTLPWSPASSDGFDFSGSMLTVGLKLDY
jgi:hypothetical protein